MRRIAEYITHTALILAHNQDATRHPPATRKQSPSRGAHALQALFGFSRAAADAAEEKEKEYAGERSKMQSINRRRPAVTTPYCATVSLLSSAGVRSVAVVTTGGKGKRLPQVLLMCLCVLKVCMQCVRVCIGKDKSRQWCVSCVYVGVYADVLVSKCRECALVRL